MIGDLKHRITLQQLVLTPDGGGGFTEAWQDLAATPVVYASVMPVSGGEQLRYHQLETAVTHRITIRYRADVTSAMRILHDGAAYNLFSVTDRGGLGTYLDILAVARTP